VNEAGDVINGEWRSPVASTQAESPLTAALGDLLDRHGAEAVMAANEQRIPATAEEVAAVAQRLDGGGDE
jgi:hypothetical protein